MSGIVIKLGLLVCGNIKMINVKIVERNMYNVKIVWGLGMSWMWGFEMLR